MKLENNKSTVTDDISAELIKAGSKKLAELLHRLCEQNLERGDNSKRTDKVTPNSDP
jgi:hypothetical protein